MPHVSKIKLNKSIERDMQESLEVAIGRLNKDEAKIFLSSLFSQTEKKMFVKRLGIAILLKENVPQSKIASLFGVTRETVNRVSLYMQTKGQGYEVVFKRLNEELFMKEFKKLLFGLAKYSVSAAGGYVKL